MIVLDFSKISSFVHKKGIMNDNRIVYLICDWRQFEFQDIKDTFGWHVFLHIELPKLIQDYKKRLKLNINNNIHHYSYDTYYYDFDKQLYILDN